MSDSAPNLTGATAAVLAGMSERHFRRLLKDGTGPMQAPNGTHPPGQFRDWLRARWAADVGLGADGEPTESFQAERTRLTKAQADKAEMEAAELRRTLIRIEFVMQAWAEKIASWRAKLLAFPSKIAQRIATPDKMAEVQAQAQTVINELLNEFSGDGLPARVPGRGWAAVRDVGAATQIDGEPVGGLVSGVEPGVKRRARKVGNLNS
jgi:hypothetical protein